MRKVSGVIIDVAELLGDTVLAGARMGAEALSRLIDAVSDRTGPELVFLDFVGIDVATSSFLRQSVIGFRDYCRRVQPDLYPAIANMSSVVEEEFRDLLVSMNDAFVACRLGKGKKSSGAKLVGRLDPKQRETLEAVLAKGEADAAALAETASDIGITAWNNRLSGLVSKGLLIERRDGRQKIYRPLIEGMSYGR